MHLLNQEEHKENTAKHLEQNNENSGLQSASLAQVAVAKVNVYRI